MDTEMAISRASVWSG